MANVDPLHQARLVPAVASRISRNDIKRHSSLTSFKKPLILAIACCVVIFQNVEKLQGRYFSPANIGMASSSCGAGKSSSRCPCANHPISLDSGHRLAPNIQEPLWPQVSDDSTTSHAVFPGRSYRRMPLVNRIATTTLHTERRHKADQDATRYQYRTNVAGVSLGQLARL